MSVVCSVVAFLNKTLNLFEHEISGSAGSSFGTDDIDIAIQLKLSSFTRQEADMRQDILTEDSSTTGTVIVDRSLSKYVVRALPSIADISLSFCSAHLTKIIRN